MEGKCSSSSSTQSPLDEQSIEELEKMRRELQERLGGESDGDSDDSSNGECEDEEDENEDVMNESQNEVESPSTMCSFVHNPEPINEETSIGGDDESKDPVVKTEIVNEEKAGEKKDSQRVKRVPEYRGTEYLGPLPDGWIEALHDSGVPIYLHRETRVVTISRPYELGCDSVRRHFIPLVSIPCENQRRMKIERENKEKERISVGGISVPLVQLKSVDEVRDKRLSSDELHKICKDTFSIKEILVYKYKAWKDVREEKKKDEEAKMYKSKEPKTGLITVAGGMTQDSNKVYKKGFILNTVGKTSVTLLHEYTQKVMKGILRYEYTEVRSSIKPYSCICYLRMKNGISDTEDDVMREVIIGSGGGESKKSAKLDAATAAIKVLIPNIEVDDRNIVKGNISSQESVELFDLLPIDDYRITDLSEKTGQKLPYHILQDCIKSNSGWGDVKIEEISTSHGHHKHELIMKVAKHETSIICKNKREGRQKCAQDLLKKLHPALDTWGSVLRLYGSIANENDMESKKVRDEVVRLCPTDKNTKEYVPNMAVLNALRNEMERVSSRSLYGVDRPYGLMYTRRRRRKDEDEEEIVKRPRLSPQLHRDSIDL